MKLSAAKPGQVVKNSRNGSFYRFERIERGKARIWPLELFPTGLLLSKPTPTLVECDIQVDVVGAWADPMVVEGKPTHSRGVYENELCRLELELTVLHEQYEALPVNGKGKQSRGSFANKVKNVEMRLVTLKRGLGFSGSENARHTAVPRVKPRFAVRAFVLVPSGRPAQVMSLHRVGGGTYASLRISGMDGMTTAKVPVEVLRPYAESTLCTH